MKKTAKILAVALALVMALTLVPFSVFAEEADGSQARVDGWKENYQLFLDTMLDDTNYASWNYVNDNTQALTTTANVYTAFALYDNAWRNVITNEVSVDDAEKILLALIEKAEYDFDDGYVDEIVKVLETAQDVNDFIQKVNQYTNIEVFESAGWSTTFEVIGDVVKIANAYQNYRDQFIAAYARVLSVQMANAYYLDMLQYIVDNSESEALRTAAQNLIDDMNASVEDVVAEILAQAASDAAEVGVDYLLKLAVNSNVYTATAWKVYGVTKSVADALWNTGDMYPFIDTLRIAYFFQSDIAEWAGLAFDGADAEKTLIAADLLLTARKIAEESLFNYKLAQNDGVIGKIKTALYGNIFEDIEVNLAAIEAIRDAMYEKDVDAFRKVVRALYIYCPVDVQILNKDNNSLVYTLKDGRILTDDAASGIYVSVYSDYEQDYLKVAFLYDTYNVRLVGSAAGNVTLIMDALLADGTVEDWSFTDVAVQKNTRISFATAYDGMPYYESSDAMAEYAFNDDFVPSKHPKVSASDVGQAVVTVGKNETKSFVEMIKAFFEKLFASLANIFKK